MLKEFFGYYGNFNFEDEGINVISGGVIPKSGEHDSADLYLVNPLEPELNTGRIVKKSFLDLFQENCREALKHLNWTVDARGNRNNESQNWGLVGLCTSGNLIPDKSAIGVTIQNSTNRSENTKPIPNDRETIANAPKISIDMAKLFKKSTTDEDKTSKEDTNYKVPEVIR